MGQPQAGPASIGSIDVLSQTSIARKFGLVKKIRTAAQADTHASFANHFAKLDANSTFPCIVTQPSQVYTCTANTHDSLGIMRPNQVFSHAASALYTQGVGGSKPSAPIDSSPSPNATCVPADGRQ